MTLITKDSIKDLYYAKLIYEINTIKEKLRLFECKYKMIFDEFEKSVLSSKEENFTRWDDYMEWKSLSNSMQTLKKEENDIKNGNYKIS